MADRLAKECGWSKGFALAVFQEYKRFIFMAAFSGHSVTPSYEIDQAWHIHLIYTRSYWKEMCEGILGKNIHHNPGNGEKGDDSNFKEAYRRTKETYKELYNREAPAEIWNSKHRPK